MTFSDLLKDILDSSKERVKTPISGAYALSFALWNWRPIALLLFENTTITQKIIVINADYCNAMSIFGPLILGLFFTAGIPYIMVFINIIVQPAKKRRLKTIYIAKTDELLEQIELVEKELKLQDKRNRSKTTEDFEQQISELQNRLDTTNDTNKTIINGYEKQIRDLTSVLVKNNEDREKEYDIYLKQKEKADFLNLMTKSEFYPQDFQFVKNMPLDRSIIFDKGLILPKVYTFLAKQEFIETINSGFRFTKKGIPFMEYIKQVLNNDGKSPNAFLHPDVD